MEDDELQEWADEATARCQALAPGGFSARAVTAARDAAVTWRWSRSESGVHRPEPFAAQRRGGSDEDWIDEPPQYGSVDRVGQDEKGRPVIVVSWFEGRESRVVEIWEHTADRSVGLWRLDDTQGSPPRASVTIVDDPARPTVVLSAKQGGMTIDGEPVVEVALERWTWQDGRVVSGELRPASAAHAWQTAGSARLVLFGDDDNGIDGEPAPVHPGYDENGALTEIVVDGRPVFGEAADAEVEALFAGAQARAGAASLEAEAAEEAFVASLSTDRGALAAALLQRGVTGAEAIVRDHAAVALKLVVRDGADGAPLPRTRLYGRGGLLPSGEPWPHARNGRALGFLAAIDLSEFPRELLGAPSPLPAAGWLLCFADLDTADDEGEHWEQGTFLGEGYPNDEGEPSRVLWVPPGQEPVVAEPPPLRATSAALPERRCAVVPQLQLPTGWDARDEVGVPRAQEEGYDEVAYALSPWGSDFVLGNATGTQGGGPEAGEVVLLHLGSAQFQDGGNVQFRLPVEALAAADWSRVVGFGESN